MTTNVTGVFDSRMQAHEALSQLLNAGFSKDDISLLVSDKGRDKLFSDSASSDDKSGKIAKGGATGAALGGVLGAIVAGLTAVGSITVPGAGLLVAGPIVAALSGAGAGATVGGLSGALINAGFATEEANRYENEIKAGKAVLVVHAPDDKAMEARSILTSNNAMTKVA